MTVKTLIRILGDFESNDRIRFDHKSNRLLIGANFTLDIPTIHDRYIEKIYEERQGLYRKD
jgi:hypothetical protein